MSTVQINVASELAVVLQSLDDSTDKAAEQLMVLELYRRRMLSSGRAAELLQMSRWDFIQYASRLGIPFFDMTEDEWAAEMAQVAKLPASLSPATADDWQRKLEAANVDCGTSLSDEAASSDGLYD